MANNRIIPATKTPGSIFGFWIGTILLLLLFLCSFFGAFGLVITCIILAFPDLYRESGVPAYHSLNLVNSITGNMRVVFPGFNLKFLWEKAQKDGLLDLRVDIKEVCEETYASKDALMKTKYVYTIKPDLSDRFGTDAAQKILTYSSFEPSAIQTKGRALFSMLLSDHYAEKPGDELLKKETINKAVFLKPNSNNFVNSIEEFERTHACEVTVRLEDSDFDERAQKFRDMISGADSIEKAIAILMKGRTLDDGTKIAPMSRPQAEKFIKLGNFDGFTENDFNLNVAAPDLKNLRDVTILGTGGVNNKKGGKK